MGRGPPIRRLVQTRLVIHAVGAPVMDQYIHAATRHVPWNKGKLVGQNAPLKLKDIWAIRVRLQIQNRTRELALFNLAIEAN